MKFYSGSQLHVLPTLLDTLDHNQPHYNTFTTIMDLRFNPQLKLFELQCIWRGFAHEQTAWEPLMIMNEDVPNMLEQFLQHRGNIALVAAASVSL